MKKRDLFGILEVLGQFRDLKGSVKFSYAVAKNFKLINDEVDIIRDLVKPSPEFEAFDNARNGICAKFAEKDEGGNPIIMNGEYKIKVEDISDFNKSMNVLMEESKDVIAVRTKQLEDYNSLIGEDVELSLHKIKLSSIPDGVSPAQMATIDSMIEED